MVVGAFLGLSVASCADQNFDWENAKSQNPEYTFRTNFESLVGTIDPNQSWDLSSNEATLGTRAITSITTRSINGLNFGITNSGSGLAGTLTSTFGQNKDFYEAIKTDVPDGKKYEDVKSVVLVAPNNGFYIYPLTTGGGFKYSMYVQVGTQDPVKVFEKTWGGGKIYCNGMAYGGSWVLGYSTCSMKGLYVEAPVGTPIQIYITDIKNEQGNLDDKGNPKRGTATGNAIYVKPNVAGLPVGLPSEIPSNAEMTFVGVEDKDLNEASCDHDHNDLVLAIIGAPYIPEEKTVEEGKYTVSTEISKRYMVEDLGSTAKTDIDFNDLVIDMVQTKVEYHEIETDRGGNIISDDIEKTEYSQKAVVRAMGGTLDFEFLVGGTPIFKKSEHLSDFDGGIEVKTMYNTTAGEINYDAKYEIDLAEYGNPWSPTDNNVSFRVWRGESSSHSVPGPVNNEFPESPTSEFSFPTPGSVPYIIAFDPSKKWRKERQKICSHFLYGTLDGEDECDICGANDTDYKVEGE